MTDTDASFPPNRSHHVGQPRTHFRNPWPSFCDYGALDLLQTRFSSNRNFVPVPQDRQELVGIQKPDWGASIHQGHTKLKATWIGHASWLVETPTVIQDTQDLPVESGNQQAAQGSSRGIRVLFDPVFSERTSPFTFIGPKRYTPTPCSVSDLPEIDLVCISHNHYDHLDSATIKQLASKSQRTHFLCPLGLKDFFIGQAIEPHRVTELDWWHAVDCHVRAIGTMSLVCTPTQHFSARGITDKGKTLWCSWAIGSLVPMRQQDLDRQPGQREAEVKLHPRELPTEMGEVPSYFLHTPRLYFAGDTGYRTVSTPDPTPEESAKFPHCPVFSTIGSLLGPFDLALLPIGLYSPRNIMSSVHCCPEDSVLVAQDVRAKKSIGMHYGTVRGGISGQYEGESCHVLCKSKSSRS